MAMIKNYKKLLTGIALGLILCGFLFGSIGKSTLQDFFLILATILAAIPIASKAFLSLRMKSFSIELLVFIAVVGALFIGEYTESSVVSFLFLLGEFLEARILAKTRSSLKDLVDLAPQEAVVIRNATTVTIPAEEVAKGDTVIIRSGGKIPVDGKIISGQASINESTVTGEPVPKFKQTDAQVFSGTIVDDGYIEMIAEKVGDETTFAKIIELVEEAQESKSTTEKFLNRFSNYYTPAIVILSILVLGITKDFHAAITLLVIACPGALVIGAPVSTVTGIGNGARNGILIKGGEIIEKLAKVDTLVFDKTGTLTKGNLEVTDIKTFGNYQPDELLRLIAVAESISEHPIGQSIVRESKGRGLSLDTELRNGRVIKGKGICATVGNLNLVIGNHKLLHSELIALPGQLSMYAITRERRGETVIFAAIDGKVEGVVSISDQIREDALSALTELRKLGITTIIMLTGDNKHTAKIVADEIGIDYYYADLLPADKVEHIKRLKAQGCFVAMAGDGINDAPAIAIADIGLAMGKGGTDISIETADVVLAADRLTDLSHALALAKATTRNIKQNTYFAIGIVLVLLLGVLKGSVHLALGMFVHEASVLLVILNGIRLMKFKFRGLSKRSAFIQAAPLKREQCQ